MMKIIDNFLTKTYHSSLLDLIASSIFDWYMYDSDADQMFCPTSFPIESDHSNYENCKEYGFSHTFWHKEAGPTNQYASHIQPMLFQIQDVTNCDFILRARADMVTWSKDEFLHLPHIDFPFPNAGAVFYINETDGDTIFYNVKPADVPKGKELKEHDRVSPKPNRLVIFDGDHLHAGYAPTKHKNRIIINSNYVTEEYKKMAADHHGI